MARRTSNGAALSLILGLVSAALLVVYYKLYDHSLAESIPQARSLVVRSLVLLGAGASALAALLFGLVATFRRESRRWYVLLGLLAPVLVSIDPAAAVGRLRGLAERTTTPSLKPDEHYYELCNDYFLRARANALLPYTPGDRYALVMRDGVTIDLDGNTVAVLDIVKETFKEYPWGSRKSDWQPYSLSFECMFPPDAMVASSIRVAGEGLTAEEVEFLNGK